MGYETMPHSPHYRTKNFQHLLIKAGFRQAYLPYFLLSQNVKDHFINKDSIVFSSIKAEVQPDFATAKIQPKHPEIQIFRAPDIAPHFFTPHTPTTLHIDSQSFQNQLSEKNKVK